MAFAFVAQLRLTDEAEAQAKSLDLEAHIAHETIGQLWERIFHLNDENDELKRALFTAENNCEMLNQALCTSENHYEQLQEMIAEYRQENNRF
jgi:uncharacterized coiled-coil DUF342 family protein